ncbi:hypothetical protein GCM10010469_49660 [Streptomyces labedae]|uniref:Uncharacterized protein n=1 Tax=Streptomyces labedae TaxID=285569 RepID=A0ABP6R581_9ACTN
MRAGISGSPFRADRRTHSADALGTPGLGAGHRPCISRRTGRNRRRRGHTFGAFIRSARHVPHRGRRFRGPRPVRHALDGRHTARNRERRTRRHSPASRLRHALGAPSRSARHVPHRGRRFRRGPRPVRHALDGRHTARNRERRIRRHSPASRLRHALGALSRLARGPPLIGRRGGRNRR